MLGVLDDHFAAGLGQCLFCVYDVFVISWLTGKKALKLQNELRELHESYEIQKTTWLGMATFKEKQRFSGGSQQFHHRKEAWKFQFHAESSNFYIK